jgi:hypothetical protein
MHCIKETLTRKIKVERGKMTFGLKCKTKTGLWNVWTIAHSGKLKQVCREMENYKLDISANNDIYLTIYAQTLLITIN